MFITLKSVKFRKCLVYSVFNFHINRNLENTRVHLCIPKDEIETKVSNVKLPEEPQNCCMSGCANCVWVDYAEEVAKILNDGGETARQKIMEHVKDPNLRAFLMMELRHLFDKK